MDIRQLKYFLSVVEHGGFRRAAEHLHIAQPSLSQAVAALERELDIELFHRIGRRVVVSQPGLEMLEPARRAVRDLDAVKETIDSLKGRLVGRVDIAVMPSQGVEPFSTVITAFGKLYPGVTVRAQAAYTCGEVIDFLNSGVSEFGLLGTIAFPPPPGIRFENIEEQDMMLIGLPREPFEDGAVVHYRELAGQRFVTSPVGSVMRQVVDSIMSSIGGIDLVIEVDHRSSILPLVLAGGGLAVLSDAWTGVARRCGLAVMRLTPVKTLQVALAYRNNRPLTPAGMALVERFHEYSAVRLR